MNIIKNSMVSLSSALKCNNKLQRILRKMEEMMKFSRSAETVLEKKTLLILSLVIVDCLIGPWVAPDR